MWTCLPPTAARSSRRLVRLAAAVTGLSARSALAADKPAEPAPIEAHPQPSHFRSSYQTWIGLTVQGPIVDPVLASVDFLGGFYADTFPTALVVRPAIGLKLPHGFAVAAGYSYIAFFDEKHTRGEEHVASEQVTYLAPITAVDLFGRIRWEERFRAASNVGVRQRNLVQLNVPLWPHAPLQVVLWNELFLGLNQPGSWQPSAVDQDLYFVGFGWQPNYYFRVEFGYQGALVPWPQETDLVHCTSVSMTSNW
jgi:hypothetical protein